MRALGALLAVCLFAACSTDDGYDGRGWRWGDDDGYDDGRYRYPGDYDDGDYDDRRYPPRAYDNDGTYGNGGRGKQPGALPGDYKKDGYEDGSRGSRRYPLPPKQVNGGWKKGGLNKDPVAPKASYKKGGYTDGARAPAPGGYKGDRKPRPTQGVGCKSGVEPACP